MEEQNYNFDSLSSEEKLFCELYLSDDKLAGDGANCYRKAFGSDSSKNGYMAKKLLMRSDIQFYISFLNCPTELEEIENLVMRRRMTKKLQKIANECADDQYVDRRGNPINPASLRSVAVNAIKMISELNGIAKKQTESTGSTTEKGGGITFNVIVPQSAPEVKIEQEEVS